MANYEKSRYWTVYEKFIDADFRPVTKGSQAKATKHFKDVALVIYRRANHDTGKCWPSIHRIGLETSLSECTVRRNLAVLAQSGMVKKKQGGGAKSNTYFINFDHKVWYGDELEVAKLKEQLLAGEKRADVIGPDRLVQCPNCGGKMDRRSRCCKACVRDPGDEHATDGAHATGGLPRLPCDTETAGVHDTTPLACTLGSPGVHATPPLACTMEERLVTSVTSDETPEPSADVLDLLKFLDSQDRVEEVRPAAAHIRERCEPEAAETASQSPVSGSATPGYVDDTINPQSGHDIERIRLQIQSYGELDLSEFDVD